MYKDRTFLRGLLVFIAQLLALTGFNALLIYIGIAMEANLGARYYDIMMWVTVPVVGFLCAWWATRLGLSHWLSWLAPGIALVLGHLIIVGVLPGSPGMPMVTMLISLIGAATGEEQLRRMSVVQKEKKR